MHLAVLLTLCFLPASVSALPHHASVAPSLPSSELPPDILDRARRLLAALRSHDLVSAEDRLEALVALRREVLIANLTPVAAAFVARFRQEHPYFEPKDAIRLAVKAVDLAPDFPPLYFNIAATYLSHDPASVGPMLRAVLDGFSAFARYPRGLAVLAGNAAFRASLILAVMLVLLGVVLMTKHFRRLVHDIGDLFPAAPSRVFSASEIARSRRARLITETGLARVLTAGVTGLAIFFPIPLGLGLAGTSLLWLIILGPYLRRGGETVVAALSFVFAFLLWPLSVVVNTPAFLDGADGPLISRCARETCGTAEIETLESKVAKDPSDAPAAVALALARVHKAPADSTVIASALKTLDPGHRDNAVILLRAYLSLLLALAECNSQTLDRDLLVQARKGFESVHEPSFSPETLRGLAIIHGLLQDRSGMEATLARLVQVIPDHDLDSIIRIRSIVTRGNPCGHSAELRAEIRPPPFPDLQTALRGLSWWDIPPALPYEEILLGRIPVQAFSFMAPVALAAWVMAVRIGRRRDPAYSCPKCGEVTCGSCNVRACGFDYCPTCLLDQVRPGFIDPLDLLALHRKREAKRRVGRLMITAASLLVPGAGQVLRGRAVRGLFLIGGLAFALSLVWHPLPLHVDVFGFTGPPSGALPALPPLLLAVIYLLSALDTWADRRR